MAKAILNGEKLSGTLNQATMVSYMDSDGNKSTVQSELDKLNTNLGEVKEGVTEHIDKSIRFVDYTNKIHRFTTSNTSWTATEDCLCVANVGGGSTSGTCEIYIDNARVFGHTLGNHIVTSAYVKKGQTVKTGTVGGYTLDFYALQ